MLKSDELQRVVFETAAAHMPPGEVLRVMVEPYVNSADEDGLRVTIVRTDTDPSAVSGATALEVLLAISDRLVEAGDLRFPTLTFVTEEDLAHSGDADA